MSLKLGPSLVQLSYAEGRKEGKEEGELHAAQALLQGLRVDRFGAVPEVLAQRIEVTEYLASLEGAARQVYRISKLEDLAP